MVRAKLRTTSSVTVCGSEWEDTPYSGYFSLECNFRVFSGRVGSAKKLTRVIYDSYPRVCSSTDSSVHDTRYCYNSCPTKTVKNYKGPSLSWFSLLLSAGHFSQRY